MGKSKKGGKHRKNTFGVGKVSEGLGSAYADTDRTTVSTESRDYIYDEVDQFNEKLKEKSLRNALGSMRHKIAKKENVLTLGLESSDEDEAMSEEEGVSEKEEMSEEEEGLKPFLDDGDFLVTKDDNLPDERAWGKEKQDFYGTNVSDQLIRKRAHRLHVNAVHDAATLELDAHREYQERMEARLASVDDMELLTWGEDQRNPDVEEEAGKPKKRTSKQNKLHLEKEKHIKLIKTENPEYYPLIDDMISKLKECRECLEPILDAMVEGKLGECKGMEYVRHRYRLCKYYSLNISAYGMLLCSGGRDKIINHPVMKKIATYQYLFKQMESLDRKMKPQLTELVRRLKNISPLNLIYPPDEKDEISTFNSDKIRKNKKLSLLMNKASQQEDDMESSDDETEGNAYKLTVAAATAAIDEEAKRHIGKVITDNRGLTPHRKKADKNPRMKYKRKYANKLKKRKGQIRDVKKETSLYSGESTGINPYVVKSRKIK